MDIRSINQGTDAINIAKAPRTASQESQAAAPRDQVSIGGNENPPPQTGKKWAFLHYGAGDNNLSSYIYRDVDEMEVVGSDKNTHILAQLDLSKGSCKRYYIQKDEKPGTITSPVVKDMGPKVNMADPQTLTDFIVWGVKDYPAEHVALIIGDHGGGTDGAIADDRDGGYGMMKPADLEKALKDAEAITGKKIDVLGFDCCLMANTEVAYQLKDTAEYLIASEENEGGSGWPYNKVLSEKVLAKLQEALKQRLNIDPRELAVSIVKDAEGVQGDLPTLSAVDMKKMGDVATNMDGFSKAILATKTPMSELKTLINQSQSFGGFRDIYDFSKKVAESPKIKDEALKEAAKNVVATLGEAIIAEQHSDSYPGAHGLQIELPTYGPSNSYKDLAFAKDTDWEDALGKIAKG